MIRSVVIAETAQKQLRKVPRYVAEKLADWALAVEAYGLEEIRKVPGYHDEPLKGKRAGQRSIRLSRAFARSTSSRTVRSSSCPSRKCTSMTTEGASPW